MSQKVVNCPYCGHFLPEEIWKEKSQTTPKEDDAAGLGCQSVVPPEEINCPHCGNTKIWKDGKLYMPNGEEIQRFLCRKCRYRFSVW